MFTVLRLVIFLQTGAELGNYGDDFLARMWRDTVKGRNIEKMRQIVSSSGGVTVLGGGQATPDLLTEVLTLAPILVAADGAARFALDAGLMPDAVIGDFDSLDAEARGRLPPERLHEIAEQDTTDFEKCLSHVAAPFLLGVGFMGARLDHELAAYNALVRHPGQRCILVGGHDICLLAPPEIELSTAPGARVSLFPMREVQGVSTGLRWPIAGIGFAPHGRVGTSNEAEAERVALSFDAPGMLLILPRSELRPALAALRAAPGWS